MLNILRLVRGGRKAVLFIAPAARTITFKDAADWDAFLAGCDENLRRALRERATETEWQPSSATLPGLATCEPSDAAALDAALAGGDPAAVMQVLGGMVRARGTEQVARQAGLGSDGLNRALSTVGDPDFATVLKVMSALGVRLSTRVSPPPDDQA